MEVAARGSGGALTPGSSGTQGSRSGGRLNAVLLTAIAVCVAGAVALGFLMGNTYGNRADAVEDGGFFERAGSLLTIERQEAAGGSRVGEDVGDGTVSAMDAAPKAEQVRTAEQIEAGTKMANAFLNLQYDNIEANIETVKSFATGRVPAAVHPRFEGPGEAHQAGPGHPDR